MAYIWDLFVFTTLFFIAFLSDAAYAYYTVAVVEKRAVFAANMSAAIHFISICSIFSYTRDVKHAIPILLGSWFGCWYIVRKNKLKEHIL